MGKFELTPEIYRENAFRVLGLTSDASFRRILRSASRIGWPPSRQPSIGLRVGRALLADEIGGQD